MKAGARINIRNKTGRNALTIHIEQNETIHHETAMLLYAAGEELEHEHRNTFGENLKLLRLEHLCRVAVRKYLIDLDPHEHLFNRVTLLGLPPPIISFLLYDIAFNEVKTTRRRRQGYNKRITHRSQNRFK